VFKVADAPDRILDFDKGLQAVVAATGTGGTVTSSRHIILVETGGPVAQENSLSGTHQQVLSTLHLI
jgi:hypothetical protein